MELLDPTLLDRADLRDALTARDISTVYRLIGKAGLTQRQIAQLTNQSQSEVSEIVAGRQVRDVEVLERIANGLGIPRARIGLSYGEQEPANEEANEDEDMKRRALITTTTIAALGQVDRA